MVKGRSKNGRQKNNITHDLLYNIKIKVWFGGKLISTIYMNKNSQKWPKMAKNGQKKVYKVNDWVWFG